MIFYVVEPLFGNPSSSRDGFMGMEHAQARFDSLGRGKASFIPELGEASGLVAANPDRSAWFVVTPDIFSVDPQGQLRAWLGEHTRQAWRAANGGILILKYSG